MRFHSILSTRSAYTTFTTFTTLYTLYAEAKMKQKQKQKIQTTWWMDGYDSCKTWIPFINVACFCLNGKTNWILTSCRSCFHLSKRTNDTVALSILYIYECCLYLLHMRAMHFDSPGARTNTLLGAVWETMRRRNYILCMHAAFDATNSFSFSSFFFSFLFRLWVS